MAFAEEGGEPRRATSQVGWVKWVHVHRAQDHHVVRPQPLPVGLPARVSVEPVNEHDVLVAAPSPDAHHASSHSSLSRSQTQRARTSRPLVMSRCSLRGGTGSALRRRCHSEATGCWNLCSVMIAVWRRGPTLHPRLGKSVRRMLDARLWSADMAEISFWQSAPFGVIIAAVLTTLSTWLLWWITRRRDDLLESRRTRLEAGVQALRTAHRHQTSGDALLRALGSIWSSYEEHGEALDDVRRRYSERLGEWNEAVREMDEQLTLTRALASHDVGMALDLLAKFSFESLQALLHAEGEAYDLAGVEKHNRTVASLVQALAEAVRIDAQTDLGASGSSWRARWFGRWKRKA